ncbi:unnamed protein product [Leptosia nina]|uniref:Calcium uniporter protein n=1 Tax=Leptosia nina TaxID=320188 RepID=A0AAV1JTK8_9NEOP
MWGENNQEVSVTYRRGLPVITVPLPSRRERCRFTLRPVSQTVGDLLEQVRPLAAHEILDALENVSDNEEDYRERLICVLPPPVDSDCLTDEDSNEEDNVTLNNLPRNILLQPAEVMIQGQIMVSDTEEEPSDSTGRTKRRRTYAWRKRDLAKNPVNWPDVQGAQDKRPIEWFENFLDEDAISLLVSESNKYAVKKNLPGDITTEDMKCFLCILLLKAEDRGVERAVAMASDDRVRIASSDTVEALLENDFRLVINDTEYYVKSPPQERLSAEEITRLSDVRNLVNQLYEALNVREHQIKKERELRAQLEKLSTELQPLEEKRMSLEMETTRKTSLLTWVGLGLMGVQFGVLARLTWWEYSWDIMEPVTYFVTYGTAIAAYAYFALTKQEYVLPDVKDRQHLITLHKKAKKIGLDINQYNYLKDEVDKLQKDLARLRDPLHIHLPLHSKAEDTKRSPLTKIKDMLEETTKKIKMT